MKAGAVRRRSQDRSHDKIVHGGERRESKPSMTGGERRESKPSMTGGERRESKPSMTGCERRESKPSSAGREERDAGSAVARDRRSSRWDDHRRERREQLVEAALVAVGRHGSGVGMEEIAAQAGTSKTVVYRHFTDRSDLHVAVCSRVAQQLLPRLRAATESSDDPREMTAAAIDTYLAFLEADPEVYRFVVTPQPGTGPVDPVATLADLIGDQAAAFMAGALERSGRDPAAAGAWGHGVVGLVRSAADWWLRTPEPMLRTELTAHLTDLAWTGLSGVVTGEAPQRASRKKEEK